MNIYDSTLNIWNLNVSPLTGDDRALPILAYSATFLDGLILYIGGRSGTFMGKSNSIDEYSFNTIHVYDTRSGSWTSKSAINGDQIIARMSHSAVLTQDKRIIIYGGSTWDSRVVKPNLAVLYVNSTQYEWFVPTPNYLENAPPPLTSHSAVLYGNYMIVAFGVVPPKLIAPTSTIYLLDTRNYTWLTYYDSTESTLNTTPTTSPGSEIKPALIIIAVVVPISIIIGVVISYFTCKNHKAKKERAIPTHPLNVCQICGAVISKNNENENLFHKKNTFKNNDVHVFLAALQVYLESGRRF